MNEFLNLLKYFRNEQKNRRHLLAFDIHTVAIKLTNRERDPASNGQKGEKGDKETRRQGEKESRSKTSRYAFKEIYSPSSTVP